MKKKHSSRLVEGQRQAARADRTCSKAVAGGHSKVADCVMGQAGRRLADPMAPHSHLGKPGGMAGERSRPHNPGL